MCSNAAFTASTPPSTLYGLVRVVPTIVPPRGRIPEISERPSGWKVCSIMPRQPVAHADHLVAVRPRAPRDRADHRIEAGAVAATGEDADTHRL